MFLITAGAPDVGPEYRFFIGFLEKLARLIETGALSRQGSSFGVLDGQNSQKAATVALSIDFYRFTMRLA